MSLLAGVRWAFRGKDARLQAPGRQAALSLVGASVLGIGALRQPLRPSGPSTTGSPCSILMLGAASRGSSSKRRSR